MFNTSKTINKRIAIDNVPSRKNVSALFIGLDNIKYKNDNKKFQDWLNKKFYDNPDSYCVFNMDEDYMMEDEYGYGYDDDHNNEKKNKKELYFYRKDIISNMHNDIIEILTINGNVINKTKGFKNKLANIIYNNSYKG